MTQTKLNDFLATHKSFHRQVHQVLEELIKMEDGDLEEITQIFSKEDLDILRSTSNLTNKTI